MKRIKKMMRRAGLETISIAKCLDNNSKEDETTKDKLIDEQHLDLNDSLAAKITMTGSFDPIEMKKMEAVLDSVVTHDSKVLHLFLFMIRFCNQSFVQLQFKRLSEFVRFLSPIFSKETAMDYFSFKNNFSSFIEKSRLFMQKMRIGVSNYFGYTWNGRNLSEWKELSIEEIDLMKQELERKQLERIIERAKDYGIHNGLELVGDSIHKWKIFMSQNENLMSGFKETFSNILKQQQVIDSQMRHGESNDIKWARSCDDGTVDRINLLRKQGTCK